MRKSKNAAHVFVEAIKEISNKPENLENLECYLSYHFETWLKMYANTPDSMAAEMRDFAIMNIW